MSRRREHIGPEYRTLTTGRLKQLMLRQYKFCSKRWTNLKLCNCRNFTKHCCINELTQKWHTGYSKKSNHTSKGLFTKKLFLKKFLTYTLSFDTWLSFVDFFWTAAYCTTSSVVVYPSGSLLCGNSTTFLSKRWIFFIIFS